MAIPEGVLSDIIKNGNSKIDLGGQAFSLGHLEIALYLISLHGKVEIVNAGSTSIFSLAGEMIGSYVAPDWTGQR